VYSTQVGDHDPHENHKHDFHKDHQENMQIFVDVHEEMVSSQIHNYAKIKKYCNFFLTERTHGSLGNGKIFLPNLAG
jgi:hypothetical protein